MLCSQDLHFQQKPFLSSPVAAPQEVQVTLPTPTPHPQTYFRPPNLPLHPPFTSALPLQLWQPFTTLLVPVIPSFPPQHLLTIPSKKSQWGQPARPNPRCLSHRPDKLFSPRRWFWAKLTFPTCSCCLGCHHKGATS